MLAHAGDIAYIGGHIHADGTGGGFAHGDHIGKILVGKPAGLIGQFIQERDGGHAAAHGEQAGFEEFIEKLEIDQHFFLPPMAFRAMPAKAAMSTKITGLMGRK